MIYNCVLMPDGIKALQKATGIDLNDNIGTGVTATTDEAEARAEAAVAFIERTKEKGGQPDPQIKETINDPDMISCGADVHWTGDPDSK